MRRTWFGLLALGMLTLTACGSGKGGDSHEVTMRGSDTLAPLATKWAEVYKDAEISASGGGTSVGIKALINGEVDIATASDEMTEEQKADCEKKTGKKPVEHIVAMDALAVYVHADNPIKSISFEELAEVYGEDGAITNWKQLDPSYPDTEITRVGRQSSSGTYKYFHDHVVGKTRKYKQGTLERNGSNDVVNTIAATPGAIGYSGMAFVTDKVKSIPVSRKKGEKGVEATMATALDKSYPLARALYLYTAGEAEGDSKKFIDWVMSPVGQQCVADVHYVPVKPTK